ncbi:DUF7344 domain-containing protein [Haloferax profundi]|uniref:DUF7344 domain-containing protein n=1 Tax=Haloferax profundi TaxID=1544718 RepID=A0A0W1RWG5_9EURY|nr:hypothetical protein [Haloferax profundi]KTG18023.1 hypothetical protein AUR66_18410 [Haloferax profundi]
MSAKKSVEAGDSLSELFDALRHVYRRRILMTVAQQNSQDEDDITSESIADGNDDALEHLQLELYHIHLPKLADAGFIDWDRDSGVITRGPRFGEIEPLLRLMHNHQDELPDDWP